MSYEGYTQKLCGQGHQWNEDAMTEMYSPGELAPTCPVCGANFVWEHRVDETNGVEFEPDGTPRPGTVPFPLTRRGIDAEGHVVYEIPD